MYTVFMHNELWINDRHSEEMIEKLESAGLGFYVKAADTSQKLGTYFCTYVHVHVHACFILNI